MSENLHNQPANFKEPLKFDNTTPNVNSYRRKLSEEICEKLHQVKQVSDPQLPDRYEMIVRALTGLEKPPHPWSSIKFSSWNGWSMSIVPSLIGSRPFKETTHSEAATVASADARLTLTLISDLLPMESWAGCRRVVHRVVEHVIGQRGPTRRQHFQPNNYRKGFVDCSPIISWPNRAYISRQRR